MSALPQAGVWKHRSGKHYLVLGVARLDEDHEPAVVYTRLYPRADGGLPMSVRRVADFLKPVEWPDGSQRPRFERLGDAEPAEQES